MGLRVGWRKGGKCAAYRTTDTERCKCDHGPGGMDTEKGHNHEEPYKVRLRSLYFI